jgi:predicted TIM-barrel enzyme
VSCQVLAGANKEALSVALAAGLQFIRAEGFVFSHVADEGFTDAAAGSLLRYRANIRAYNILIFTDIKKKHRQDTFCSSACFISKTIQQVLIKFSIRAYNKICWLYLILLHTSR